MIPPELGSRLRPQSAESASCHLLHLPPCLTLVQLPGRSQVLWKEEWIILNKYLYLEQVESIETEVLWWLPGTRGRKDGNGE